MAEAGAPHARGAAGLLLLLVVGCGASPTHIDRHHASLTVHADVSGLPVSALAVEVTGQGIDVPLVFNLALADGVASGNLRLPAGSGRLLTGRAFDSSGEETHRGSRLIDVRSADNEPVVLTLLPVDADQGVTIALGNYSVTITPAAASLVVGDTVRLVAVLRDENDQIVQETVNWAALDPAVATVHADGLVLARAAGAARIVAVKGDRAAVASITVTP